MIQKAELVLIYELSATGSSSDGMTWQMPTMHITSRVFCTMKGAVHTGQRTIHNINNRRRRKQAEQYALLQLVNTVPKLQATDPRDTIYASVGLAPGLDRLSAPDNSQNQLKRSISHLRDSLFPRVKVWSSPVRQVQIEAH